MLTDLKRKCFDFLTAACLAEGGDGDAVLIHEKYQDLSNDFDAWLKENNNTWWTKSINKGMITYNNDQECIYFTDFFEDCSATTIIDCGILNL